MCQKEQFSGGRWGILLFNGQTGMWKHRPDTHEHNFRLSSRTGQTLLRADYYKNQKSLLQELNDFFLIFLFFFFPFTVFENYFKTPAFFSGAKKNQENNLWLGHIF